MKKTALFDAHQRLNPKFADFAGWQMPIHYGSQIEEHHAVRQKAGVFDVSHMQVLEISGAGAVAFLSYLLANDIQKVKPGKAMYTCMLNAEGGIIDDLIAYRLTETDFRVVLNAGCAEKDLRWIQQQAQQFSGVVLKPRPDLCILAIQGPEAIACLNNEALAAMMLSLKPFEVGCVGEWMVATTGYTGELGVEIALPRQEAIALWDHCLSQGIRPIGLGARDTLRLEAGLNLYGQDMTESETPWTSRLHWTVVVDAHRDFIGKAALVKQKQEGVKTQLICVLMKERGVLRHDQTVLLNGIPSGVMTSGSFSPTLGYAIGFARIATGEGALTVDIRGRQCELVKVDGAFVRKGRATRVVEEILSS